MDGNGNWDLNSLSTIFPHSVITHIISIKGLDSNDIADKPYWKLSNSRSFSIRSTYDSLERVMTNVKRCRRFIGQSPSCPCCHEFAKTTIHVICGCPLATAVWTNLIPSDCSFDFFHSNLQDWMCSNLVADHIHPVLNLRWSTVFTSTPWQLCNNRNNWVFNGHRTPTESMLHKCITWARYYAESGVFQNRETSGNGFSSPVCWKRPDVGWDNGFERLVIQSDSLEAIQRLNATSAATDVHALVRAMDRLRNAGWATILQWIPRDANKLADAMTKFDTSYDLSLFAAPPSPLQPLLASDCSSLM
ncbi:hypothetical protein V6N11_067395 [Hibiscus sabdariffa]|uniref:RNase H type-1 domain-containing protein n=1 Tax=Hibiscus sabdariffa TaxID=183260 RepID=A0ABR2SQM6_9ROSI